VAVLPRLLARFGEDDGAYREFAEPANRLWQSIEIRS
jgi:hypothetical protein